MFRSILVPVDYSEHSKASVRYAAELAKNVGATLHVVHVWDRPTYASDAVLVRRPGEEHCSLAELIQRNAENDMKDFLATLELGDVKLTHELLSGDPTAKLVEQLKGGGYDLVVLGTHGRTGLMHLLMGSVAEKLVRLSPVPVLTVPPASRGR
ncbi:MAG TPA: universal stress protein [Polyangiaceae bacterium]|jgi:universal stress protein A|nr:universal stress protein [Polyangiaceae bacterium]